MYFVGAFAYPGGTLPSMELRHLRYFVAVAEEQNVSLAAKRLHVSRPPLSRQIRDLETEMGFALFKRSTKAIRLTEAGRVFLFEARAVLQRVEDAVALTKSIANQKRNQVRVGYTIPPAVEILPRALRAFQRTNPRASVDLRMMSEQKMLRALRSGDLDVCLTAYVLPQDFEGLLVEELGTYPLVVVAHKNHRFARLREVPISEVARQSILAFSRDEYPIYQSFLAQMFFPYTSALKTVAEYESLESIIAGVEAGRGVAILYQGITRISGERLVLRPLKPAPPSPPIVIAYRKERVSATVTAFVKAARTARLK
jgi:LysR family transcriptional regulator, benzoate and cis,cis-muconate-responsive activator of ben and cat genes